MKDGQKENPTNNKMMRWGGGDGKKKRSYWTGNKVRCQSVVAALPQSRLPGYCLLFTPLRKGQRSRRPHLFFSPTHSPHSSPSTRRNKERRRRRERDGACGWRASWWRWRRRRRRRWRGVELEKKKNIERESSDQTALIRRGGRGGVLL